MKNKNIRKYCNLNWRPFHLQITRKKPFSCSCSADSGKRHYRPGRPAVRLWRTSPNSVYDADCRDRRNNILRRTGAAFLCYAASLQKCHIYVRVEIAQVKLPHAILREAVLFSATSHIPHMCGRFLLS